MKARRRAAPGEQLPSQAVQLAFRGAFQIQGHRGHIRAQSWPRRRPKQSQNVETAHQNELFKTYVKAIASQSATAIEAAKLTAYASGYTWRDVIGRALIGRLFQLASDNLQAVLDALNEISTVPGSMLFCNTVGWMAIIPTHFNDSLEIGSDGLPHFAQLFHYLTPTEGTMLCYHDGDWLLIPAGEAGQVLMVDAITSLPTWSSPFITGSYIIACSVPSTMAASQTLLLHKFAKAVTTPADFSSYGGHSSEAGAGTAAAATTVITVSKALAASPTAFSTVGSITFAAGAATATFQTVGHVDITWAQGDVLALIAPASPDSDLADFYSTLVGFET